MSLKRMRKRRIRLKDITSKLNLRVKPMSSKKVMEKLREMARKYKKCTILE